MVLPRAADSNSRLYTIFFHATYISDIYQTYSEIYLFKKACDFFIYYYNKILKYWKEMQNIINYYLYPIIWKEKLFFFSKNLLWILIAVIYNTTILKSILMNF